MSIFVLTLSFNSIIQIHLTWQVSYASDFQHAQAHKWCP